MNLAFDPLAQLSGGTETQQAPQAAGAPAEAGAPAGSFAAFFEMLAGAVADLLTGGEQAGAAPPQEATFAMAARFDPETGLGIAAAALSEQDVASDDVVAEFALPAALEEPSPAVAEIPLPPLAALAAQPAAAQGELPNTAAAPETVAPLTPPAAAAARSEGADAQAAAADADAPQVPLPRAETQAAVTPAAPEPGAAADRANPAHESTPAAVLRDAPQAADARNTAAPIAGRPDAEFAAAASARGNEIEAAARAAAPPQADPAAETLGAVRATEAPAATGERTLAAAAAPPQPEIPARVTWLAQQGGGTARLALHPRELGEVEVSVRVRGRNVEVQFVAHDPAAQLAVAGAREQLVEALGARDLRMESFQVRSGDDPAGDRDFAQARSEDDAHSNDGRTADERGTELRREAQTLAIPNLPGATGPGSDPLIATSLPVAANGIDVRV